ncbi:BgTH12-02669 [Blumeria graminis f. sp. triticale]|uniref:Bgt-1683 n=3 Tax=Blumeria graminis TaxID=34373 RepID=A0A061HK48_BLUGR|nr:hypothetical protein BGT96224_1683 [Blumeria graminis f. sp. tritici 96224]CAD6502996.1 BgTH12-02669 [Blumeria graminis f. sp. triticale]VDB88918.1 Bgt-1683 [Blumeria graminis f. sp. tritici]
MPPVRTTASRAGKSERTHEENVERAFIAASRRCDRTLEARLESARRASEIHKARTGRGLRITEKDVQNEEMYEEEDDDLPLQYRHLTAGFQTSSPEFNRRFAAYLTTHVAVRTALEQSIIQSYAQQQQASGYDPNQSFQGQHYGMYPSPLLAHQAQSQPSPAISTVQAQPTSTRYSPYQIPSRTTAVPLPQQKGSPCNSSPSMPMTSAYMSPCVPYTEKQAGTLPTATDRPVDEISASSTSDTYLCKNMAQPFQTSQAEDPQNPYSQSFNSNMASLGPFSMALPAETQAFLGPNIGYHTHAANDTINGQNINLKANIHSFTGDNMQMMMDHIKPEALSNPEGLNSTLLPESTPHDSPYLYGNQIYSNITQPTSGSNCAITPVSEIDEDDWRYFININRSDGSPLSD